MSDSRLAATARRGRPGRAAVLVAALLAIVAASLVTATAQTPPAAAASRGSLKSRTICSVRPKNSRRLPPAPGAYVDGKRYRVEDDRFGTRDAKQCLTLTPHGRPAFKVSTSKAASAGNPVQAFPYIQYGCYWGWCTPGSALPLKVSQIKKATSTWYTTDHAHGTWNVGYDLWLNSSRLAHGHANRAELMIWLTATTPHYRVGGAAGTKKVKVGGRRFYLTHWRTGLRTIRGGWDYIQYRLVGGPWHVRSLNIRAVLLDAARRHLISSSWYLQGILAGYEIWLGGQHLSTSWFTASVTGKHRAKPRPIRRQHCPPGSQLCPKKQHVTVGTGPGAGGPPVPVTGPFGP
jgi:hypothetical protein